ncbi:hypothetical protein QQS21_002954 [Conoideocrella luteorostrata]|uniref:Transketolase N-terminal domain-containing protein n=1 Tax=Conoideocrella luteorostrata TaxID=1105319 RepID=A0AAJ0FW08_9HYPO|nr:hypothetical protein QQS21_002954 [Conoideocrella luteorostrata]
MAPRAVKTNGTSPQADMSTKRSRFQAEDRMTINIVLRQFRCLIANLCQQFNDGHPGSAIGIALWKYIIKYSLNNSDFFNRDRFVLSNGNTGLFQYTFLQLIGYKAMTFDQLKSFTLHEPTPFAQAIQRLKMKASK